MFKAVLLPYRTIIMTCNYVYKEYLYQSAVVMSTFRCAHKIASVTQNRYIKTIINFFRFHLRLYLRIFQIYLYCIEVNLIALLFESFFVIKQCNFCN